MTVRRAVVAAALLLLLPSVAHAWTPATHIFLGESVLANLGQIPAWVADLLRLYPFDFLYGNIAADTSIAKKYVPVGRHCHSWHVGQEIYDLAESDALRSFGLGYLSHLAADTVAHNFFVPRQLVATSSTMGLGHSYWESRFEMYLGEQFARTAVDILREDHGPADAHLDRILSPTIFSVRTSRRLFRGWVGIAGSQGWQRAFKTVAANSRWDLTDNHVEQNMAVSFQLVVEMLGGAEGTARRLDPAGHASLDMARRLRRELAVEGQRGGTGRASAMAEEHFSLPTYRLEHWETSSGHRPWRDRTVKPVKA